MWRVYCVGVKYDIQKDGRSVLVPHGHVLVVHAGLIHRGAEAIEELHKAHIFATKGSLRPIGQTNLNLAPFHAKNTIGIFLQCSGM